MSRTTRPWQTKDRPPARGTPSLPADPCRFKIDLDEGSSIDIRLDPDGTLSLTCSDGLGRTATAWTTSPELVRLLKAAARLAELEGGRR